MATVTVRQVVDAMIEDPTPKITSGYVRDDGSCAIGGAAMLLGLAPTSLDGAFDFALGDLMFPNGYSSTTGANDETGLTKAEIGEYILDHLDDNRLDRSISVTGLTADDRNSQEDRPYVEVWAGLIARSKESK